MNHSPVLLLALLLLLSTACRGGDKTPAPTATLPAPTAVLAPSQPETGATQAPSAVVSPAATATRPPGAQTPPTLAPTPTATPRPDGLEFHFGPGVDSFDRSLIERAVEVTSELLAHGAEVSPPSAVFADSSPQRLAASFARSGLAQSWRAEGMEQRLPGTVAEASYRGILINTGNPEWLGMEATQRLRAVAHEYVHVIQLEQTGLEVANQTLSGPIDRAPPSGPFWLLEGSAEVVSWLVLQELDLGSYPESLFDYAAGANDATLTLPQLESFIGYRDGGSGGLGLSVLAVDYLLRSRSLDALFDFWRDIGQGSNWTTAFTRQFGLPPAFFYVEFNAYYADTWEGFRP